MTFYSNFLVLFINVSCTTALAGNHNTMLNRNLSFDLRFHSGHGPGLDICFSLRRNESILNEAIKHG